jgi:hypothetical protein
MNLRKVAYSWHDRQNSELYKFASSGYIENPGDLIIEVNACLKLIPKFPEEEREFLEDGLNAIVDSVRECIDIRYDQETGWLMAPWCSEYKSSASCRAIVPEKFVAIATDDVNHLSRSGIERILGQFEEYGEAVQMASWLIEQREDLEGDIDEELRLLAE